MDLDPLPDNILMLASSLAGGAEHLVDIKAPTFTVIVVGIIAIIGLFLSAFMSGSETSYFSLSRESLDDVDDDSRERILKLLAEPERLLATILICNNLVNVMIIVLSSYVMSATFQFHSTILEFIVQSVILTFLILLFGEILPKIYANNHNVEFADFASYPLTKLAKAVSPLSKFLARGSVIVNKIVTKHTPDVSVDDLSKALDKSDVTSDDEKELLEGILTFGEKTVSEIMRARVDVVDISIDSTFDEVVRTVVDSGYSRIPVYKDTSDSIKGVLYAKDLLPYIGKQGKNFAWQRLIREAYFVPETRMINDLLEDFRKTRVHIAVVVDEFGCTQGIATLEDVLEEIVGDIDDEYDEEEKFYTKISDDTYVFDGTTMLNDFYRVTGIEEDEFAELTEEVETIAGLLLTIKGNFPREKEPLEAGRCKFLVLKVEKHRIEKVRVTVLPLEEEKNN